MVCSSSRKKESWDNKTGTVVALLTDNCKVMITSEGPTKGVKHLYRPKTIQKIATEDTGTPTLSLFEQPCWGVGCIN